MAKSKAKGVETVVAQTDSPVSSKVTSTALDMVYDVGTKKYFLVKVEYSLDTGEARVVSKEAVTGNQAVAIQAINNEFTMRMIKMRSKKK